MGARVYAQKFQAVEFDICADLAARLIAEQFPRWAGLPVWPVGTQGTWRVNYRLGDELVLVHGDLWQGNTLWNGDSCSGLVDWDAAGAGSPGIDLRTLRSDAVLFFGSSALASSGLSVADEVLAGWQQAAGRLAKDVAYWDVAAALGTVGDMGYCLPGDLLGEVGRPDLDAALLTARRDAFLAAALARLDSR